MSQYCKLTGVDLMGDGATNGFKCMCLNCKSCHPSPNQDSYNESFVCDNEKVMEVGKQKILAAIPEGFEIETLTLKPMALKDPRKKCKNYQFNRDVVMEFIDKWFEPDPEKENAPE